MPGILGLLILYLLVMLVVTFVLWVLSEEGVGAALIIAVFVGPFPLAYWLANVWVRWRRIPEESGDTLYPHWMANYFPSRVTWPFWAFLTLIFALMGLASWLLFP